ncbi:urease accessory protein UreF [Flavobacterium sp. '19STA2R22 D10 B1']|uniref:urease accessory protein UreF n=1 Tax=Flavobacterium aerium TaxID=3037261 RepID=UPI00278C3049|nr:urease accessory protein UreF [Flavobacterium sp. '19STA2R22 D10 B1']
MDTPYLGSLLHLTDPTLPIGGYTHSNGLETYVQYEIVHNKETAASYVVQMLKSNLKYTDAALMKLAYDATALGDIELLIQLDQECTALKSPKEIRIASQKLGLRLLKVFKRSIVDNRIHLFEKAIAEKKADSHYCIVFGLFAQLMNIPLPEALYAFYYNACIGMITNAVKLIPLGQLDGQDILFELYPLLQELAVETLTIDRSLIGLCNSAFDIRCMQHEHLYSRLYMS